MQRMKRAMQVPTEAARALPEELASLQRDIDQVSASLGESFASQMPVAERRAQHAELVERLVGHEVWTKLDPNEVHTTWAGLKQMS
jgi:hypothetical protein